MKRVVLLLLPLLLIGCDTEEQLPVLWTAPDFALTNQNGEPFGAEQVRGKTYIATLFFTTCAGPCPMMANRLRAIQDAVNDPDVLLVSISCDPENDTVARLKDYADIQDANPKRWFFLTGKLDEVKRVADAFKLGFEPATKDAPISHSTYFLLVDPKGQVRGTYRHDDDEAMQQLKLDAQRLAKEKA